MAHPPERTHDELTTEHSLYHDRRPRRAGDELLRESDEHDAQPRSHRQRGHAVRPLLRDQLDLHTQPRDDPHRHAHPREPRDDARHAHRQSTSQRREAPADRRLPDCDHRKVASGAGPAPLAGGLRFLERSSGAGDLPRSGLLRDGREKGRAGLRERRNHRQVPRLARSARHRQAVLPDVPSQGTAPTVGPQAGASVALHRSHPHARHLRRRLLEPALVPPRQRTCGLPGT